MIMLKNKLVAQVPIDRIEHTSHEIKSKLLM